MKTIAQLKRDANSGKMYLELTARYGQQPPEKMQGQRHVTRANTKAIFLDTNGKESELLLPSASLVEYTDDKLIIYTAGERELTESEKAFLEKAKRESYEYTGGDVYMNDFWHIQKFFKDNGFSYLLGYEKSNGKRLNTCTQKIEDDSIKGEPILSYKVILK